MPSMHPDKFTDLLIQQLISEGKTEEEAKLTLWLSSTIGLILMSNGFFPARFKHSPDALRILALVTEESWKCTPGEARKYIDDLIRGIENEN